jgi:hypothetical protein
MIHLNIVIGPFNLAASATLMLATAAFGYVLGYIGAWVWNRVHSQEVGKSRCREPSWRENIELRGKKPSNGVFLTLCGGRDPNAPITL